MPTNPLDSLRSFGLAKPPKPIGTPIDLPTDDPTGSSTGKSLFEGVTDSLLGLIGVRPETKANLTGQLGMAALPILGAGETGIKGLFSRVNRAAEELPTSFHPNKALSQFSNKSSPEEMDYRGLTSFLKGKGNAEVAKPEVLDHLSQHPLKVDVVEKGGEFPHAERLLELHNRALADPIPNPPRPDHQHFPNLTEDEGQEYLSLMGMENDFLLSNTAPKYQQYQMPDAENYKETLIKLPRRPVEPAQLDDWHYKKYGLHLNSDEGEFENPHIIDAYWDDKDHQYKGSHWDEPNVLVHTRSNERDIPPPADFQLPEGHTVRSGSDFGFGSEDPYNPVHWVEKTGSSEQFPSATTERGAIDKAFPSHGRVIENIQSDWHQQGAQKGYRGPEYDALVAERSGQKERMRDLHEQLDQIGQDIADKYGENQMSDVASDEYLNLRRPITDQIRRLRDEMVDWDQTHAGIQHAVPDAPFKTAWPDLALKQQIMDVVDRPDLDFIGITPGEELVKRGEGHSPQFNNEVLPTKLENLLKPFGGKLESTPINTGTKARLPMFNYDPEIGKFGGYEDTMHKPVLSQLNNGDRFDTYETLQNQFDNRNWPMKFARLSPEMKAEIKRKGLPLLMLMGLTQSQNQEK